MKKFFLIFLFILFNQINIISSLKEFQNFSYCINNKRTVEYKIIENKQNITKKKEINCGDCNEGFYLYYDYNSNKTICKKCPINKTNKGKNLLINFWSKELIKQYSIKNNDWILNNNNLKSIVLKEKNETIFSINLFFENDGELIINFSSIFNSYSSYLLFYINEKQVFTSNNEQINDLLNFNKIFKINKGKNNFKIIHKFEFNDYSKNSFILIHNILLKNIHTTAFNCNDLLPIDQLKLDKCEYENICDKKTYCIDRFYSKEIDEKCELNSLTQQINYFLNESTICKEILKKENKYIPCEHCSYGQYSDYNISNIRICKECEYNKYNDEEINDKNECKECDMKENRIENILYIRPKLPNYYNDIIGFKEIENKMKIEYEKFNEKEEMKVYIQIEEDIREYKEIIPEIEINKGNKHIIIKGKNINMKKIIFYGTERGSGYKCIPKLKSEQNEENKCDELNYIYSKVKKRCIECPLFSRKVNDICEIYPLLTYNKYLTKIDFDYFYKNFKEIIIEDYQINLNNKYKIILLKDNYKILGEELKLIEIVRGINEKGLIMTYEYLNEEENIIYESIIYFRSIFKENNEYIKKLVNIENNTKYYFYIETNNLLFNCINSDLKFKDSKCKNNQIIREYYFNQTKDNCFINKNIVETNVINKNIEYLFLNNDYITFKNLFKIYKINESIPFNKNFMNNVTYINNLKEIGKCKSIFIRQYFLLFILILFLFIYYFLFIGSKKKKNNYIPIDKNNEIKEGSIEII